MATDSICYARNQNSLRIISKHLDRNPNPARLQFLLHFSLFSLPSKITYIMHHLTESKVTFPSPSTSFRHIRFQAPETSLAKIFAEDQGTGSFIPHWFPWLGTTGLIFNANKDVQWRKKSGKWEIASGWMWRNLMTQWCMGERSKQWRSMGGFEKRLTRTVASFSWCLDVSTVSGDWGGRWAADRASPWPQCCHPPAKTMGRQQVRWLRHDYPFSGMLYPRQKGPC